MVNSVWAASSRAAQSSISKFLNFTPISYFRVKLEFEVLRSSECEYTYMQVWKHTVQLHFSFIGDMKAKLEEIFFAIVSMAALSRLYGHQIKNSKLEEREAGSLFISTQHEDKEPHLTSFTDNREWNLTLISGLK